MPPRLPYVPETPDDPRVAEAFGRLRDQWKGAPVLNLYRLIGWAPGLVGPWLDFARAMRFQVSVSPRLCELMIVRSGQILEAEYEWKHHSVAARNAGIPDEKIHDLAEWKASNLFDPDERAVLALADETALGRGASEETLCRLKDRFPSQQVAEFVVIAGFYSGVARIVNSFQVPLEAGFESMAPRRT